MLRMVAAFLTFSVALASLPSALAATLEELPSPRPNGWVLDQANLLSAAGERRINEAIENARQERAVELMVLTVTDIGARPPRAFATSVFNRWGIGHAGANDGVLIFVARNQRAAEIVLGAGIDGAAQTAITDAVMADVLLPSLRRGDFDAGLSGAVDAVLRDVHRISDSTLLGAAELEPEMDPRSAPLPATVTRPAPRATPPVAESSLLPAGPLPWFLGVIASLGGVFGLQRWLRFRARNCGRCGAPMQRLDEAADDAHLQPAQRREEQLGSVDYDIWACSACSEVIQLRYAALSSRYAACPGCRAITLDRRKTVLSRATHDHGGRVRIDHQCAHCGHQHSSEHTTPRLQRTSASSSSPGRRSSSSASRSGGGRSRGGGSSGRW